MAFAIKMTPVEMTEDEVEHDKQVKRDNQRDEYRIGRNFGRAQDKRRK